jgi:hypothetical protein
MLAITIIVLSTNYQFKALKSNAYCYGLKKKMNEALTGETTD